MNTPPESAPEALCCESRDAGSSGTCTLCHGPVCRVCQHRVNGARVCTPCARRIRAELSREESTPASIFAGALGAVLGASLGGVVWAGIHHFAEVEVGYVAVLVGWLAGLGARTFARGRRGRGLQVAAALAAVFGLNLGKYLSLAFLVVYRLARNNSAPQDLEIYSPEMIQLYVDNMGRFFSGFDVLWLILALGIAWRTPARSQVVIEK